MEVHWKAPLQVKGFLKIVEFVIALLALSLVASFSVKLSGTCNKWTNGTATNTFKVDAVLKYPYSTLVVDTTLSPQTGGDITYNTINDNSIDQGYKPASQFFVAWGSLSLFYAVIAILVYMFTTANSRLEWVVDYLILSDLIAHIAWVLCWFIASVEWAVAQSQMKPYLTDYIGVNYFSKNNCNGTTVNQSSYAQAAIGDVFGWTSIVVWGVNIFWVVADTSFYIRWKASRSGNYQNI